MDKLLEGLDLTDLDFDFIKAAVLEKLNNNLQIIEKKSQLIDVQKEITRYQIYNRKGGRKYREHLKEQDTLLQEIKKLESKSPLTEDLEHSLKELATLRETIESLNGMSSLLTQFSSLFSSLANDLKTATPAKDADDVEDPEEKAVETELAKLENQDDSLRKKFEL